MKREDIVGIVKESINALTTGGILEIELEFSEDMILLGAGTPFDSIAFVTLFMEIEERLNDKIEGEDVYLQLDEIHEFNSEELILTVRVLIDYIVSIC